MQDLQELLLFLRRYVLQFTKSDSVDMINIAVKLFVLMCVLVDFFSLSFKFFPSESL